MYGYACDVVDIDSDCFSRRDAHRGRGSRMPVLGVGVAIATWSVVVVAIA